jgi:hypothetical protein
MIEINMKFKVALRGQNFLLRDAGSRRTRGFYTTRFVEADTPEQSELIAVQLIQDDQDVIGITVNPRDDSPMIFVDEIVEIPSFDGYLVPGAGYSWFPEGEDEA